MPTPFPPYLMLSEELVAFSWLKKLDRLEKIIDKNF
jgi:hypothetical protein